MKYYYLLAATALLFAACERSYDFSGIVYDGVTNKPVAGAECVLHVYRTDKKGRNVDLNYGMVTTDSTGVYALSYSSSEADGADFSVKHLGYIGYLSQAKKSKSEGDIYLYQRDTDLELTFQNLDNSQRSIWLGINYDPIGERVQCGVSNCKPIPVPALGTTKRILRVPGNFESRLYYLDRDFNVNTDWDHKDVLKAKIYCPRGDTTRLTIKF